MKKSLMVICMVLAVAIYPFSLYSIDIFYAIKNGETKTIRIYIKNKLDLNIRDSNGDTPLIYAAKVGNFVAVKLLIGAKAQVNLDNKGTTPLMAGAYNGKLDIVKLLVAAKADINAIDENGDTALILATKKGHYEIVKFLIYSKADLNIKNKMGHTALIEAGIWPEIFDLLILSGAK